MRGVAISVIAFIVMFILWILTYRYFIGEVREFAVAFAVFASGPVSLLIGEWLGKPKQQ